MLQKVEDGLSSIPWCVTHFVEVLYDDLGLLVDDSDGLGGVWKLFSAVLLYELRKRLALEEEWHWAGECFPSVLAIIIKNVYSSRPFTYMLPSCT